MSGEGAGVVNIYYLDGGCYSYHTVSVHATPAISGSTAVCIGSTITLTATPSGGTWITSGATIALVSGGGVVSGGSAGVVNIYYDAAGCYAYHTVTVNATPYIFGGTSVCAGSELSLAASPAGGTWSSGNTGVASVSTSGMVNAISAGETNIYYYHNGCFAYHTVSVDALPAVTATATQASCGYSYTLSASGASTYSWAPSTGLSCYYCATPVAYISSTTTYTVTGVTTAGCHATTTVTADANRLIGYVTFAAGLPDTLETKVWLIQFNAVDSTLTAIDSTTTCQLPGTAVPLYEFMDVPAGDYLVKGALLHPGAVGSAGYEPTYGYSSMHWYAATSYSHGSGTDYSSIHMIHGTVPAGPGFVGGTIASGAGKAAPGGTIPAADGSVVNVYPNPSAGTITIRWEAPEASEAGVMITDMLGREAYTAPLNITNGTGQQQLDLTSLKDGVYIITIKSSNVAYSGKLIIRR